MLFFITSTPTSIWYQQAIVLVDTWETEELPDLLNIKQTGFHTLIVFNSNGSEWKTTSNQKHKRT